MMKKAALYIRLSSEDENEGESNSIKNQRDLLRAHLAGQEEFAEYEVMEFCDDGYSGTNFDRPAIRQLLELVRRKEIHCILVKDFSRFGRNYIEVCDYLDQIFPFLQVRFIAVNENYDSSRNNGHTVEMDVAFKTLIYELYSRDISEKVRSVQQAKIRKGEYLCSIAFYGYAKSPDRKNVLIVDEPAAAVIRRIFHMASEGVTFTEIAVTLNREGIPSPLMYRKGTPSYEKRGWKQVKEKTLWTAIEIRRILSDERYTGKLIGGKRTKPDITSKKTITLPKSEWIVVPDVHEAIIPEELFQKVKAGFKSRNCKNKSTKPKHIFYGILRCAHCNHSLQKKLIGKVSYLACELGRAVHDEQCQCVKIAEEDLKDILLSSINTHIQLMQASLLREGYLQKSGDTISRLQIQIAERQAALSKLRLTGVLAYEELCDGKISKEEYLKQKKSIAENILAAEASIQNNENAVASERQRYRAETKFLEYARFAKESELSREMLEELIQVVRIHPDGATEIVWKFKEYT